MAKITLDSVYKEIAKAGEKGKTLNAQSKMGFIHELLHTGKISQIGKKYFISSIIPSKETIYRKIENAAEKGISLSPLEKAIAQDFVNKGTIQIATKRYYLASWAPRNQKATIEWLLEQGSIKKVGTKFVISGRVQGPPRIQPVPIEHPSFLEFVEAFQKIYRYLAGGYQRSVSIVPLIDNIREQTTLSRDLIEKWVLELPHIFVGSVDLRPFPGEAGISLKDGTEVNRIYVERELVGL